LRFNGLEKIGVDRNGVGDIFGFQEARLVGVVEISRVIGYFIGEID
jgi:hypothetical protein